MDNLNHIHIQQSSKVNIGHYHDLMILFESYEDLTSTIVHFGLALRQTLN